MWLVLTALKRGEYSMQREIASAVGIEGATLTHHFNRMEAAGLIARRRDPGNRRIQIVVLTPSGDALFAELLDIVIAFDRRLREDFDDDELAILRSLLGRLRTSIAPPPTEPGDR